MLRGVPYSIQYAAFNPDSPTVRRWRNTSSMVGIVAQGDALRAELRAQDEAERRARRFMGGSKSVSGCRAPSSS